MEDAAQDGIPINGEVYEVPTMETFDIAEARILKRYSGVVLEDFQPVHPEAPPDEMQAQVERLSRILFDPDFKAAFAHIAYRRAHPDAGYDDIAAIVEKVSLVDVTLALFEDEEEDAGPPSLSGSESNSDSSKPSSPSASGSLSTSDSDSPDASPPTTGTSESATSSPVSLAATSGN